ncbi:malectin domain-containing carbohydrate-binding protein [Formosa maritima]|nr:malectin domain-containing carbohydrate-binding protein [Formosa maritima]
MPLSSIIKIKNAWVYFALFCLLTLPITLHSQTISFGSSGLINETVANPTSLEFGPDGRLYVSQQNGVIWAYTIERDLSPMGDGVYTVIASEQITAIRQGIPNHFDDGSLNMSQQRLITGIMTAGTAEFPILYVTSSDYLIGGGGSGSDSNLDTNSSMLSKLTWNGSSWDKLDLIRGLPRCEENHAINGLDMFERDGITYLLVAQGGQTNKGAPSNNFAGTPEYFLSASILIVNLTQLESMPVHTDLRSGTTFVYDLPTLNDPSRADIDNTHPEFPYEASHPLYHATIDIGDPFGGNNSLNQAFPETGGPIQIFSPGYRNAYDVVVTEGGKIYSSDNGPNGLWGGFPKIYDKATDLFLGDESTITYDPANHYITNEFNENGSNLHGDPLHYIGLTTDTNGTYYGGHPNPILAFPSKAQVKVYEDTGSTWSLIESHDLEDLLIGVSGYFHASFSMDDFPEQPRLGEYLLDEPIASTKNNILAVVNSSTNGITEYTASNFNGVMQGNILTASFSGDINRYILNTSGDAVVSSETTFNGFGSIPLDVTAQGDLDIFPGTVWAATYGSNNITIFEPTDINCLLPGDIGYDANADNDGDGYSNQDEIDNGTNICSQSSKPTDNDQDNISDLNDTDDDNDGILDVFDAFALDSDNGTTTNLPIDYPFWNNNPGTGMFGLGFTGLMIDPNGSTDYLTQFDIDNMSFGGAAGKATVDEVSGGDALGNLNTQDYGFQFGVQVDSNSNPFTIHSKIESPYFGSSGAQQTPVDFQSYGISFGNGDQDNYLKIVIMNGISNQDAIYGLQVLLEQDGVVISDTKYDIPNILNSSSLDLYASIDPATNTAQPFYSIDDGMTLNLLGAPIILPLSFLDDSDNKGLAISLISTGRTASGTDTFSATWDFIEVTENQDGILNTQSTHLDFGLTPVQNNIRRKYIRLSNEGGPTDSSIEVTAANFTGINASLFSTEAIFPISIGPGDSYDLAIDFDSDNQIGIKEANLEIIHSGNNSPLNLISLTGQLTDIYKPIVRINAGGPTITASDGGPDWEDNTTASGSFYSVSAGSPYVIVGLSALEDESIPDYLTPLEYYEVMRSQNGNSNNFEYPMIYTIPVPNGDYIVNMYFANLYNGTRLPGQRIFSVNIENERRIEKLDASAEFGHRIAGMIQNNVTVTDGNLEIEFFQFIQNPMVNAIEILGLQYPELIIEPIANRTDCEFEISDFSAVGSGGNPNDNLVYAISGQPLGIDIEPTNGLIFGSIDETAISGGPNNDGVYQVTVTLSKPGSLDVETSFQWTVLNDNEAPILTCPIDIIEHVSVGTTETIVSILNPTATDNCATTLTYNAVRSDALELNDPYPLGDTTITWTVTDVSENTSLSCMQTVSVIIPEFTIDLQVSLQGRSDYSGAYSVILYDVNDLLTPAYSLTETSNNAGQITLSTTVSQSQYKILVKHPMYLQRVLTVNLTSNASETITELLAGDVNNDNTINIFDFGILSGTFGLNSGDIGFDPSADFDHNQNINIFDFGLLSGNFSLNGETQND